ncbi:MAG: carboxymuconolactone decarboxylase family protein [Opitutaceae bacterium]
MATSKGRPFGLPDLPGYRKSLRFAGVADRIYEQRSMPNISPLSVEEAPPETKAIYESFQRRLTIPHPPNFITTLGHSPSVAQATWTLVRDILVTGAIPRWKKEMILVAISKERGCRYCVAAHRACCRMLGVNPALLDSMVRDIDLVDDPGLRAILKFALKAARDPQSLAAEDFAMLRGYGLKEPEILELVAMAGLSVYINILADTTAMQVDEMFLE